MVMIATLSFLACVVLMLAIGGASYASRGAIKRGAVIMAVAAGLAATTALQVYPALRLADSGLDDTFRTAELDLVRADRDRLLAEVNQRARDNDALAKTSAFFTKLHKERLTRISEELRTVKDLLLGPSSGLYANTESADVMLTTMVEGPAGFDSIVADIRRLKSLRPRSPDDPVAPTLAVIGPQRAIDAGTTGVVVEGNPTAAARAPANTATAPAESETVAALRRALDSKMATAGYRVEPIADTEYVAGRPGRYYLIELRSQKTGQRFTFDSGKYTLQGRSDYKASFDTFAADVLKQLEGEARIDLYVRGSADAQAYSGVLEPGYEYRKIAYLPSTARGRYLANAAVVPVAGTVKNSDLPNLRGEFLRTYLAELYPTRPATLLEGIVTKKDSPAARYTDLILYVAW